MSETYNISTDFGGIEPKIEQLYDEIIADSINIPTSLLNIISEDDLVTIIFASTISPTEKTALDTLVSNHVPIFVLDTPKSLNIVPRSSNIRKSSYERLAANVFPGSLYATAKCVSYMDPGSTSYSIQIFDKTNKQTLAEGTFTNTKEEVQDLGILVNLPTNAAQIEILAKVDGKRAYLESVIICYN